MKYFHELNNEQQQDAVKFAKDELKESIRLGFLAADRILSDEDVDRIAITAAEGGTYNDEGKPTVSQLDVPWYFQGGCI